MLKTGTLAHRWCQISSALSLALIAQALLTVRFRQLPCAKWSQRSLPNRHKCHDKFVHDRLMPIGPTSIPRTWLSRPDSRFLCLGTRSSKIYQEAGSLHPATACRSQPGDTKHSRYLCQVIKDLSVHPTKHPPLSFLLPPKLLIAALSRDSRRLRHVYTIPFSFSLAIGTCCMASIHQVGFGRNCS